MKALVLLGLMLLAKPTPARGQTQTQTKARNMPASLGRLCGRLMHVDEIPVKKTQKTFEERTKSLPHVRVRLNRASDDHQCCDGLTLAAEVVTKRGGSFEFRNAVPGSYWVVVLADGTEYRLVINYVPSKKENEESCSDFLYEIKNGELRLARIIQVD